MSFISTFCFIILSILSGTHCYHWDGNVMYDLEYQGTSFDAEAVSWSSNMNLVTSGIKTTQCGPNRVLGGYNIMAGSSWDFGTWSKTYTGLPAHNTIYFKGRFYMIDYWGYSSDHFHLGFDSFDTMMWQINSGYASATGDQWGNPAYNDLDPMMVYFTIPHTANSLTFSMENYFYSASTSDKQSIGFRDITMTFVTEATVPSASCCGVSGGWPLPSNICGCGSGTTMSPANSGICVGCDSSCLTCNDAGNTKCTSCSAGKYLVNGACSSCDSSCLTCNGASRTVCTTCQPPLILVNGSCCDASCATCSGTGSTDCTSCASGEYLENGSCYACDSSCITCNAAGSSACTSCDSLKFLVSGACVPCDSSCLTCGSGPTICATCASKKYLSGTNSCQDCDTVCAECSGASNQCSSCVGGYYNYWNSSCLSTCDYPLQQTTDSTGADFCSNPCGTSTNYLYQNRSCLSTCPSPLSVVANPGVQYCLSLCSSGHFLYENKTCLSSCLSPFVQRFESNAQYCDRPCDPGIFWYKNGDCLASCPAPYVQTIYSGILQCLAPCPESEYFYEYEKECSPQCESPFKVKYIDVIKICYSDVQISAAETAKVQDVAASIQSQGAMASGGMKAASAINSGSPSSALLAGLSAMLQYIRYMKINYPPKVQMLFLVSAGDPISLGFNFDIPSSVGKELADNTLPDVFEKYNINSNFVYNLWDSLMTLLVVLVVIGILSIVKFVVGKEKYPRIFLMLSKILGVIRWNIPIMLVCSSSGDIFFYASLQIRSTPLDSLSAIICFCMSLVMMIVVLTILMIGFKILRSFKNNAKDSNWAEKWKGYGILYEEYEEESIWSLSYMILFLIRGIIFNLTLANLFNFPLIQCVIINVSNLLMLGYLLYLRPLKNLLNLVQLFVNEGLVNIIGVSILILAIMDKAGINGQSTRMSVGDAIYFVIKIFNTFGLVFMGLGLLVFLVSLYKVWRHLRAQKITSPMKIFKAMILGKIAMQKNEENLTNDSLKRATIHPVQTAQTNEGIYIDETEMSSRVQMVTDRSDVLSSMSIAKIAPIPGFQYQDDVSVLQITGLDTQQSHELIRGGFGVKEEKNPSFRGFSIDRSQIISATGEATEAEKSIETTRDYSQNRSRRTLKIRMKTREPAVNMSQEVSASDIQIRETEKDEKSSGFIRKWGKFKGHMKSRRAINQEQEKEEVKEESSQNMIESMKNWEQLNDRIKSKGLTNQVGESQIIGEGRIDTGIADLQIKEMAENPQHDNSAGFIQDWGNLKGRLERTKANK